MLKRIGPAAAGLVVVAVLVIGVPSATGHPEECATTAAWAAGQGYSPYSSWSGAEEKSGCVSQSVQRRYDDSKAKLTATGDVGTRNLKLISSDPKPSPFGPYAALNSDLAFEDGYAYQGNYNGVSIWNVKDPENPRLVNVIECLGAQNDVTINDGILITSTDSRRVSSSCDAPGTTTGGSANPDPPTVWEGIRVWDVRDKQNPALLANVRTDCGSHTHTVIPEASRLLVYVSSYDIGAGRYECSDAAGNKSHDKISIVEVPKSSPGTARVINEPVLFPDGGYAGDSAAGRSATRGCHDITVYPEKGIAAGACTGEGVIMDISDPVNPEVLSSRVDPNFAFWHSATISNDGKKVLFTDEKGGGSGAECNPTVGPTKGADAIYDITDPANPKFMSYFKIPRTQTNIENCVAHNGNLIPVRGRDLLVQSWYQGGVSVIDWTDGSNVKEIAWFDRGPWTSAERPNGGLAGFWSSYYYNGFIYGSEIQRGFDVFKLTGSEPAGAQRNKTSTLNAQTQYSYR